MWAPWVNSVGCDGCVVHQGQLRAVNAMHSLMTELASMVLCVSVLCRGWVSFFQTVWVSDRQGWVSIGLCFLAYPLAANALLMASANARLTGLSALFPYSRTNLELGSLASSFGFEITVRFGVSAY